MPIATYDQPIVETYVQPSTAFGATTESFQYIGPKGKKGRVRDFDIFVTASMVGTTTVPELQVGTAQGDFTNGRFRLGTTAILGYVQTLPYRASNIGGNTLMDDTPSYQDFPGHVMVATVPIPADTPFFITRLAGTGGAPAGTGASRVVIEWW